MLAYQFLSAAALLQIVASLAINSTPLDVAGVSINAGVSGNVGRSLTKKQATEPVVVSEDFFHIAGVHGDVADRSKARRQTTEPVVVNQTALGVAGVSGNVNTRFLIKRQASAPVSANETRVIVGGVTGDAGVHGSVGPQRRSIVERATPIVINQTVNNGDAGITGQVDTPNRLKRAVGDPIIVNQTVNNGDAGVTGQVNTRRSLLERRDPIIVNQTALGGDAGVTGQVNTRSLVKRGGVEPVSASTARVYLNQLTVTPQSNVPAYDRDLFPHWIESGGCSTRETVLKRDGTNVQTNPDTCAATSGTWYCEYTGNTYPLASDVDIDHMVPLANAWRSGARDWTTSQRRDFANDLTRPQLIAVDDSTNQQKSDQGPEDWLPPRTAYRCEYIRAWTQVKFYYKLTVTQSEYNAIDAVLVGC